MCRIGSAPHLLSSLMLVMAALLAIVPSSGAAREMPADTSVRTAPAPAACSPRPPVKLDVKAASDGQLQVTVTAGAPPLRELRFGPAANAVIDLPGAAPGSPGNQVVTLPGTSNQYVFTVRRVGSGQASTVPLVVVDGCGEWPTFVGGGTGAWRAALSGKVTTAPEGAPIVGAVVRLEPENLVTVTGSDGSFAFDQAPVGAHTLRTDASGFGEDSRSVTLSAGETARISVGLTAVEPSVPPPAGATASIRVKATWNDGSTPAGEGVIISLNGTEIGTTNAAGLLTTRFTPGEYSLTATLPSLARGATTVSLSSGQTADVTVALDEEGEATETADLVLDELADGTLPDDARSVTLRFVKDGTLVPVARVLNVELLAADERSAPQDLTGRFGVSSSGTIAATNLAAVMSAFGILAGDGVLNVDAEDARGFSYAGSLSFAFGTVDLAGQLVAPPSQPALAVEGIPVRVQIGEDYIRDLATDAQGAFQLHRVPHGDVTIAASTEQDGWGYSGLANFWLAQNSRITIRLLGGADLWSGVPPFDLNSVAAAQAASRTSSTRVQSVVPPGIPQLDAERASNNEGMFDISGTESGLMNIARFPRGTSQLLFTVGGSGDAIDAFQHNELRTDPECSVDAYVGPARLFSFVTHQIDAWQQWKTGGGFIEPPWAKPQTEWVRPGQVVDISELTRNGDIWIHLTARCELADNGRFGESNGIYLNALIVGADFHIDKITRDKVNPTNGQHDRYSIPRSGESNHFQRTFDLVYRAPRYIDEKRLKVELIDEHDAVLQVVMDDLLDNLVKANRVKQLDEPYLSRSLRVTVTFDPDAHVTSRIDSQPPPAYKIRYRFTLSGVVGQEFGVPHGWYPTSSARPDQTRVYGRDGAISHRGDRVESDPALSDLSYALWRMPDGFPRYSVRDPGLDDWAAQRTYTWMENHRDLITRVNDISGEHARNWKHPKGHALGLEMDMFHVYTFPGGAVSGGANYEQLQFNTLAAMLGNDDARERVNAWAVATRERFDLLMADPQVTYVIYVMGAEHQQNLHALVPTLGLGWARDLLVDGTYRSPSGVTLNLPAGPWANGHNAKFKPDPGHNDHIHLSLR